jgi:hypothetical protein
MEEGEERRAAEEAKGRRRNLYAEEQRQARRSWLAMEIL